ncbi:MAG: LysM peptidoglycan-binding domain-containing protein, partial [Verrucomicrobiales bacterium]
MSKKRKVNRKRRRSPWFKMFAKTETRLSAHVTCEDDWQTDVPNIRLSRAFVIVLLMHLVVGGALIAFTLMNPNETNAQGEPAKEGKAPKELAGAAPAPEKPQGPAPSDPKDKIAANTATKDMRRHIVHSGDSVAKIARQYGVTAAQIHEENRIDELYQLYQGRVLVIPVSVSTPIDLNSRFAEAPSTNGSNSVSTSPSRLPTTVPRPEIPGAAETAAGSGRDSIDHSLMHPEEETSRPIIVEEEPEPEPEPAQVAVEVPVAPPAAPRAVPTGTAIVSPQEESQTSPAAAAQDKSYT